MSNLISDIHYYLRKEMILVDNSMKSGFSSKEKLIEKICLHLSSAGKRIRPILVLLSSRIFGDVKKSSIDLAVAIEFMHMATLLHDDVVDESDMRRFAPSANSIWGNKASILVGDFLFGQSFKLMVSTNNIEVLNILSGTSSIIAEGEVIQLNQLKQKRFISREEYFEVIKSKTAELFSAACSAGAVLANGQKYKSQFREFGDYLGKIFQISDDMLDYFGEKGKIGKNVGDDFYEGKITLPIILLQNKLTDNIQERLSQILFSSNTRSESDFLWVVKMLQKYEIKKQILSELQILRKNGEKILNQIPFDNIPKNYLAKLLQFATDRTS